MDYTDGDFDIFLSDQAVVDKKAEDWAAFWQESARYVVPEFDHTRPHASSPLDEGRQT